MAICLVYGKTKKRISHCNALIEVIKKYGNTAESEEVEDGEASDESQEEPAAHQKVRSRNIWRIGLRCYTISVRIVSLLFLHHYYYHYFLLIMPPHSRKNS